MHFMQDPLQGAAMPAGQPGPQQAAQNIPQIVRGRSGWYPRWWILAAFCSTITFIVGRLLWTPILCPDPGLRVTRAFICQVSNWPEPVQALLALLLIVGLFCGFYLLAFTIGFGPVEVYRNERSVFATTLRAMSEFGPLYPLLMLYGSVALVFIFVMWWLDVLRPFTFAFLGISVFLAMCCQFHRFRPDERRSCLILAGLLTIVVFAVEIMFKPNFMSDLLRADELLLLCVQAILVLVMIWLIIRRPPPDPQLTAQDATNINIDRAATPLFALGSIMPFRHIFAPRPVMPGQANANNQGTPPGPQAPGPQAP
jgi:hypothetical protein